MARYAPAERVWLARGRKAERTRHLRDRARRAAAGAVSAAAATAVLVVTALLF